MGCGRSLLQKSEHDTIEKEQEEEEGREMMMQNNQKVEEREVMQNDQVGVGEPETFDILRENRRYFPRFDTHGCEITITVRQPPTDQNPLMWLDKVFAEVHAYLTNSCNSDDYIGVTFTADALARGPVCVVVLSIRTRFSIYRFVGVSESSRSKCHRFLY